MANYKHYIAGLVTCALFTGCTTPGPSTSTPAISVEQPADKVVSTTPDISYRPFDTLSLQALLQAEFMLYRGQHDNAAKHYVEQAQHTGDPAIAKLATQLAEYAHDDQLTAQAATAWLKAEPNQPIATAILARDAARNGDIATAISLGDQLANTDHAPPYLALIDQYQRADESQRTNIDLFLARESKRRPNSDALTTAIAVTLHIKGNSAAALTKLEPIATDNGNYLPASFALGQILGELGEADQIFDKLWPTVADSNSAAAMQQLARMLLRNNRNQQALVVYQKLLADHDASATDLIAAGVLAYTYDDLDTAISYLDKASNASDVSKRQLASAAVYTALIFIERQSRPAAQAQLDLVEDAELLTQAVSLAIRQLLREDRLDQAQLLVALASTAQPTSAPDLYNRLSEAYLSQGDNRQALAIVNNGLEQFSNNTGLLYTRALIHQASGQHQSFEADMAQVLQLAPNNPHALNALGYFWVDTNQNFDQAAILLQKALQLMPNNAAIQDSLGWYYFKVGELAAAIELLTKAYRHSTDPEIAAHLATALRAVGRNDQAVLVYQHAMRYYPDSKILKQLSVHLGIKPNSGV